MVYEAAPISLFPVQDKTESEMLKITLSEDQVTTDGLDQKLPKRPDAGFFGRDETLLALDRSFDTQQIVLLHALLCRLCLCRRGYSLHVQLLRNTDRG